MVIGGPSEGHQPGCAPDEGGNQWSSEGHQRVISLDAHRDAALHHAVVAVGRARTRGVALVHRHPRLDSQAPVLVVPDEGCTHWPSGGHSLAIRGPSKAINGHQWQSRGHQRQSRGLQRPSGSHQRQSRGPSTAIKRNRGQSTYTMPPDCTSCSRQQPQRVSFEQQPGPESAHPTRKSAGISNSTPSPATDECR